MIMEKKKCGISNNAERKKHFQGKVHSKVIISDLVGCFFHRVRCESPRSNFEQEHGQTDCRKWPKKLSGDNNTASIMSLVLGI